MKYKTGILHSGTKLFPKHLLGEVVVRVVLRVVVVVGSDSNGGGSGGGR